jgi:glycosyltransferase involved in cell wall biosynthesis
MERHAEGTPAERHRGVGRCDVSSLEKSVERPVRIAHLIETDGPGGAERVVAELASGLQRAGADNVVFVPERGDGWLGEQLRESRVAMDHFHLDAPVSPACAQRLAAAFRRHNVAVAHSHEFSMAVYGAWAACLAGIPHLITMHGSRYYAGRLQRRVALRAAIGYSRRTVAVSNPLADHLRRDLFVRRSRISVITNGVRHRAAVHTTIREELRLAPDDMLAVAVGNLYPVKGHQFLIEAIARITARHPRLHVAICGRGDQADVIAAGARERRIHERVHMLGLRPDVDGILAAADLFVMPSISEGLPLALLEAMFAGCPIVASDVGEVAATLDHGSCGLLVAPGETQALANAMDELLSNRTRARDLGDRAKRRALAEYDVAHMIRRYAAMYESAGRCSRT